MNDWVKLFFYGVIGGAGVTFGYAFMGGLIAFVRWLITGKEETK